MAGEKALKRNTKQLVVVSGTTSIPSTPKLPGKDNFDGPILHQESFGQSDVLINPEIRNVIVIGGGKSPADMVYACLKAGKTVSCVIRKSGTGPGFLLSPKGKGPYKNAVEIGSTRIASTISPSIYNTNTLWTRLLYGMERGRNFVKAIWEGANQETLDGAHFESKEDAKEGFGLPKRKTS